MMLVAKKENQADVFKETIAQIPISKEKAGMCLVHDALLYCEPCNIVQSKLILFMTWHCEWHHG